MKYVFLILSVKFCLFSDFTPPQRHFGISWLTWVSLSSIYFVCLVIYFNICITCTHWKNLRSISNCYLRKYKHILMVFNLLSFWVLKPEANVNQSFIDWNLKKDINLPELFLFSKVFDDVNSVSSLCASSDRATSSSALREITHAATHLTTPPSVCEEGRRCCNPVVYQSQAVYHPNTAPSNSYNFFWQSTQAW